MTRVNLIITDSDTGEVLEQWVVSSENGEQPFKLAARIASYVGMKFEMADDDMSQTAD